MIKNKIKNIVLFFSILILTSNTFAIPANSAVGSGSIEATGSIGATCSITATPFAFGAISDATTAISTVSANCTNGTAFTITNAANTNSLYLNGDNTIGAGGTILFPITLTGGAIEFTATNSPTGKLSGNGTGGSVAVEPTLTATSGTSTGKTPGSYSGTVILTVTY